MKCDRDGCDRDANKWVQTERKDMLICGHHSKAVKGTKRNITNDIEDVIQVIRENSDTFNSGMLISRIQQQFLSEDFPATVSHNLTI